MNKGVMLVFVLCLIGSNANSQEYNRLGKAFTLTDLVSIAPEVWPFVKKENIEFPAANPDAYPDEGTSGFDYWRKLCKLEGGIFFYAKYRRPDGVFLIKPSFVHDYLSNAKGFSISRVVEYDQYGIESPLTLVYSFQLNYFTWPYMARHFKYVEMPYFDLEGLVYGKINKSGVNEKVYGDLTFKDVRKETDSNGYVVLDKAAPGTISRSDLLRKIEGEGRFLRYGETNETRVVKYAPSVEEVESPLLWEVRIDEIQSKYGLFWRNINRPKDRQYGVAGAEMYLIELATGKLMAVNRVFIRGFKDQHGNYVWHGGIPSNACHLSIDRLLEGNGG